MWPFVGSSPFHNMPVLSSSGMCSAIFPMNPNNYCSKCEKDIRNRTVNNHDTDYKIEGKRVCQDCFYPVDAVVFPEDGLEPNPVVKELTRKQMKAIRKFEKKNRNKSVF